MKEKNPPVYLLNHSKISIYPFFYAIFCIRFFSSLKNELYCAYLKLSAKHDRVNGQDKDLGNIVDQRKRFKKTISFNQIRGRINWSFYQNIDFPLWEY